MGRTKECLGFEPRLDEMLDDPVVQAMMDRDGVRRTEIEDLIAAVQTRLFGESHTD